MQFIYCVLYQNAMWALAHIAFCLNLSDEARKVRIGVCGNSTFIGMYMKQVRDFWDEFIKAYGMDGHHEERKYFYGVQHIYTAYGEISGHPMHVKLKQNRSIYAGHSTHIGNGTLLVTPVENSRQHFTIKTRFLSNYFIMSKPIKIQATNLELLDRLSLIDYNKIPLPKFLISLKNNLSSFPNQPCLVFESNEQPISIGELDNIFTVFCQVKKALSLE